MKNIKRFENFEKYEKFSNILPLHEKLLLETKVMFDFKLRNELSDTFNNTEFKSIIDELLNLQGYDLDIKKTNKDVLNINSVPYSDMVSIDDKNLTKIGRIIKLLLPNTPDKNIEKITNIWKSSRESTDDVNIKIIEGYKIKSYYDCSNYSEGYERSVLGKSCMNKMYLDVFDLYVDNSNIKLLVKLDEHGKLLARALLFNTINNGVYMDNVYSIKDKDNFLFKKYAEEKGWGIFNDRKNNDREYEELLNVQLEKSEYSLYPFLDHFSFLNIDKKILSTQFKHWENSGDSVIKITDHKNNKWEKIYGDEKFDYEPVIYSQVLPDDWEVYYDRGVLDLDDLLDYGVDFESLKRDYYNSDYDSVYNDVSDYIEDDTATEFFEEQDKITQIEYAVKGGYDIIEQIIDYEITDEEELSDVMTKYFNDGTERQYEELEDVRDELESIVGIGLEHKEGIENEPKHYKFIEFFLEEVYDSIEDIEDYNRDNYKEVIDNNQLEDDLTSLYVDKKYRDIDTVTELLREVDMDSDEQKINILNNNWYQETFIENAREDGYDLNELIQELNPEDDDEDEDEY